MLFVSKKEPLNCETLPDTSLHNVRKQASLLLRQEPSSICPEKSSTFFQLPETCVSKLTKEQLELHREFLRLGSLLMSKNVDLFHHAVTQLSSEHDLKTTTPGTAVSDIIPPILSIRQYNRTTNPGDFVAPRASNRKYVFPKDVEEKEFYQCTVCKERRKTNSFGMNHTHSESVKSSIRWYCPLCDSFFAVTHRGYHVKSRHSDILIIAHSESSVTKQKQSKSVVDSVSLKRPLDKSSDEDECEIESLSPSAKVHHSESPTPSTVSVDSMESSCFSNNEISEEYYSPSSTMGSMLSSPHQDVSSFVDESDYNDLFRVYPSPDKDNDLFATSPASPYSL